MVAPRVLVVDDEKDVLDLVAYNLKLSGFEPFTADRGLEALQKARESLPDLIILDLMLPEIDGLEVTKLLKRDSHTAGIPILMLTAKSEEIDKIVGLELGADDYLTKPFSPRELILRVKSILRRGKPLADGKEEKLRFGALVIDVARHSVWVQDRRLDLTATEFRLLQILAERRGRVQTREKLLNDVWDYDAMIDTRTVDTHVRRLRSKLGSASSFIETVRGVGYRFSEE